MRAFSKIYIPVCIILSLPALLPGQEMDMAPVILNDKNDSIDFYLGLNLGYSSKSYPFLNNKDLMVQGLIHALQDSNNTYLEESKNQLMQMLSDIRPESVSEGQNQAQLNLERCQAFLAENKDRPGIITTASGLQYEVIKEGEGRRPEATSTVEVHYEGMLSDGTVFDSSYERGESISFPLNRVIKGWSEGVQLMHVGSVHRLFIPPELAYGSRELPDIPANSLLIFKIELLSIE